ncbi:hypothetical protein SBOR_5627 [Sclerotinia borealis F-4128]|uniref:Uncharacterized protein n=1 Tax=Sclerotinia borealis (strain F-4128) TaxID=1432307 RepID=W9CDP3_SCLBF|nr:hypothetical protein SBOR_5627 [Sclerotinia borealis F-4128]
MSDKITVTKPATTQPNQAASRGDTRFLPYSVLQYQDLPNWTLDIKKRPTSPTVSESLSSCGVTNVLLYDVLFKSPNASNQPALKTFVFRQSTFPQSFVDDLRARVQEWFRENGEGIIPPNKQLEFVVSSPLSDPGGYVYFQTFLTLEWPHTPSVGVFDGTFSFVLVQITSENKVKVDVHVNTVVLRDRDGTVLAQGSKICHQARTG